MAAEALVSAVFEQLVSLTGQQLQHEWSLTTDIEGKVRNLTSNLEAIQAVLVDAEKRQITEASVRHWLCRLKEVSFQIDVVLDEWNTAILRANISSKKHPFGKVCIFVQSSFFHALGHVHRVCLRRRIASEIEKLDQELNKISSEKVNYNFSITENSRHPTIEPLRPKSTSFDINVAEVFGREAEKNKLLEKLLSKSSEISKGGHDIIPLVGAGGIGKTTLAQLMYNDEQVSAHFDLKIWVCVSDPFDEMTIARVIAESLKIQDSSNMVGFQTLLERIHESIRGKKFLLVLDDVWAEDDAKWKRLENSLRSGGVGSKILVTTRKEKVAIMMGARNSMISVELLSEEFCWSIFDHIAFLDKEKCKELEEIGREIARKSKGLPLVAKALGSLMRFKKYTKEEWESVLSSELWKLQGIENEVFVPLLLSYYDLPPLEKRCFLYSSFFPKDSTIDRDDLILLWSSEGYLDIKEDYNRIGRDCFENLAMRSLFQDFEKDEEGDIIRCKMHDIVHDFVLFLSKNEWLNVLLNSEQENIARVEEKAFHCTLVLESVAEIPSSVYNKKFLRTLSIRSLGRERAIRWDMLSKLTCLRTLTLDYCELQRLPKDIDKLIHLRYLSLTNFRSGELELPESLCNLFNLQTLKLNCNARRLPKGIHKLVNLRHLYLKYPILLPEGLGKLTCLETLNNFEVSANDNGVFNQRHMKLEDLGKLNHLKGSLFIVIGRVIDVGEAERAKLKRKEGLVELTLVFFWDLENTLLLEGLQPHPNLKRLTIAQYQGTTVFPSWMTSLINLKSLELRTCYNCECLAPFGKLPSLETLTVVYLTGVKRVGLEFLGIEANRDLTKMENCPSISFPKLKRLQFWEMSSWEEWEPCSGSTNEDHTCLTTIMPSLVSLEIRYCYSLKPPLPDFLRKTPLQNLIIEECPNLESLLQQGMETKELVKILTSPTSEFATRSAADDYGENLQEHRAPHSPTEMDISTNEQVQENRAL